MKCPLFSILAILIGLTSPRAALAEEIPIVGPIPPEIQEIDVTYSETGPPRLSFRGPAVFRRHRPPFRPSLPQFDFLSAMNTAQFIGPCEGSRSLRTGAVTVVTTSTALASCRATIDIQNATSVDVLSYAAVSLQGHASHPLTIGLIDGSDKSIPLGRVEGRFDLRLALKPLFKRLNPTEIVAIAFEGDGAGTTLTLERFSVERSDAPSLPTTTKGFWIWDYRSAVTDPDAVVQQCKRMGATRMLIQMPHRDDAPDVWTAYAGLFAHAASSGLDAFALDGYPDAIYDPTPLMDELSRLRLLLPNGSLRGVQLDIEPYLLARFSDPHDYDLYLRTVEHIKSFLGGAVRLSMVMPFWFHEKTVHHRPLDFEVMDRVDEVAVMSYRTDVQELEDITEPTLRYGDAAGVPVWPAVETRPLPVDRQITLIRESRPHAATAYLDRTGRRLILSPPPPDHKEGFRIAHRTTIRPERLTFAGKTRQEVQQTLDVIFRFPHTSLAGVLIHDLPGYVALPE